MNGLEEIRVRGGTPLCGSITIQGSKNAALPVMAASLLHRGVSVLRKCPRITDVFCMEEILKSLGAKTWWEQNDLYLDCADADKTEISSVYTGKMRSSVILLGALLGRNKEGIMGYPGGCVIGKRPVDLHVCVLRALGAEVTENDFFIKATCSKMKGCRFIFPKKSVGATEQALLAAVFAEGRTILENCAVEPEILTLCRYLNEMGASIEKTGESRLEITGMTELNGGDMEIPPDRIVAGTYLCAAAATRGKITIENPPEGEMEAFLEVYRKMGGQYEWNSGKLVANATEVAYPVTDVETEAYPGFPTDLQSPLMAVLATIPGNSSLRENIFEDRFRIVKELKTMGADIQAEGRTARINGGNRLHGAELSAAELRGGAALIIAALAAEGESVIKGCSFIHRGYENICRDLTVLGGQIRENTGNIFYENIQLQEKIKHKWKDC